MKSVRLFIVLSIISILICLFMTSCDEENGAWYTFFRMEIDSLSAPGEIMQTDTLRITYYSVPMSCCYNFYRYDIIPGDFMENRLRLQIVGRETQNLACACLPRVIEMEYEVYNMLAGEFYIEVIQPDDSTIRDTVLVNR
jgi:hypothetical protein